jgi:hypothetical protein
VPGTQTLTSSKDRSLRIYGDGMIIFGRERWVVEKDGESYITRSQRFIWWPDKGGLDGSDLLRLIHASRAAHMPFLCHTLPLPFFDSAMSFVKVRAVSENIRTASPTTF